MRNKRIWFGVAVLWVVAFGLILLKTERLFLSWETAVINTITNILDRNQDQLPQEPMDLAMLMNTQDVNLYGVREWQVQNVELANTVPLPQALFDDDPIYRLKADLYVTYGSGEEVILRWESWQYGLVLGSSVLSLGDGPPGYIRVIAPQ